MKKQTFVAIVIKGGLSDYETTTPGGEEVLARSVSELKNPIDVEQNERRSTASNFGRGRTRFGTYIEVWRHDAPARA